MALMTGYKKGMLLKERRGWWNGKGQCSACFQSLVSRGIDLKVCLVIRG